jgi:hypothetical protein
MVMVMAWVWVMVMEGSPIMEWAMDTAGCMVTIMATRVIIVACMADIMDMADIMGMADIMAQDFTVELVYVRLIVFLTEDRQGQAIFHHDGIVM